MSMNFIYPAETCLGERFTSDFALSTIPSGLQRLVRWSVVALRLRLALTNALQKEEAPFCSAALKRTRSNHFCASAKTIASSEYCKYRR